MESGSIDSEMTFEDAILALEKLVRRLEANSLGLEQSLAEYSKAVEHIAFCQSKLKKAKQRVDQLKSVALDGQIKTEVWQDEED